MKEPVAPVKPTVLDPLAAALLDGLRNFPCAQHVVLGGYFALRHYCDYRQTHDVDAWWSDESDASVRDQVRQAVCAVLEGIAQQNGLELTRRRFGDTESWELARSGGKVFTFQIAARTVRLLDYLPSPWPPLRIESLPDNIGSKMNALVQRGAPRDFVDIHQLVQRGLLTEAQCWSLWQRKNPDLRLEDARREAARRLHEIELRRPLESIDNAADRVRAQEIRQWYRDHFLR